MMPRRPLNFLGLHLPLFTSRYIYLKSKLVHANFAVLIVSVFKTSVFQKPPDVLFYTNQDHHHPNLGPVVCVCPPPLYIQNADRTKLQTSLTSTHMEI